MGGYILCQTKKAQVPYFIENISTNIYSLEELCYYLYHNLYLIDATIINEGLVTWLMEELELPKLAAKLRPYMGKAAGPEDVLYPIFKEINYLSYEELRGLNERLAKLIRELPAVRRKKKGDELVANGMYVSAIRVYQEVLKEEADLSTSPEMIGSIYHNLGCACSYLFQMEKAAEYFWMAYEEEKSEKALKTYLLAYQMAEPDDKLEARMEELEVSVEMKADVRGTMERGKKATLEELDIKTVDEILAREMKEYHRSTGA